MSQLPATSQPRALQTNLNRVGASQQIVQALLRFIGDLPAGTRLGSETSLAEQFQVSRPTVREALQTLSAAHRVQIVQGRNGGIFVASSAGEGLALNINDSVSTMLETEEVSVDELVEARLTIEPHLAGFAAARATPADIEAMQHHIEQSLGKGPLDPDFLHCDRLLHLTIARAARNSLLTATTAWFREVLQPQLVVATSEHVSATLITAQHRAIVEAIAEGNAQAAHDAMSAHISYFQTLLEHQRAAQ